LVLEFQYVYDGDSEKVLNGRLIKPGDLIESESELIHGHFTPKSKSAKAALAARMASEYSAPATTSDPAPALPAEPQAAPVAAQE
jgi:hypothetical protein